MEDTKKAGVSRRSFLKKTAIVGGGVAMLSLLEGPAFMLGQQLAMAASGDLDMLVLNGGLENLAVKAYEAAASLNLLEKPVLAAALAFANQHSQHQQAFENAIKQLGGTPAPLVITKYPALKSQADILAFAQTLELAAAGTYFINISKLSDPTLVNIVASIMPIEIEHATIISSVLKQDTIPSSFPTGKTQDELNALIPTLAPAADKAPNPAGGPIPPAAVAVPTPVATPPPSGMPTGAPSTGLGGAATTQPDNYAGVVTATLAAITAAAAGFLALHKKDETQDSSTEE